MAPSGVAPGFIPFFCLSFSLLPLAKEVGEFGMNTALTKTRRKRRTFPKGAPGWEASRQKLTRKGQLCP